MNPVDDDTNIKVPIPSLNEERRGLVKLVKKLGEEAKISIRNIRRDANDHLKKAEKDKQLIEDLRHDAQQEVHRFTYAHIKRIN